MAGRIRPTSQQQQRNASTMTRTPTTTVTAIDIAARAFAWDVFQGGRLSDHGSGTLPSKSQ
jgi:hypothetical protein